MNVAILWFTLLVLASYSIGDAYQGRRRDPYWAHRSYLTNSSPRSSGGTSRPIRRYSNDINSLDNHIWNDRELKKYFHGNGNSYQYNSFFNRNRDRDSFRWDYPSMEIFKVKMPKLPPLAAMPKPTASSQSSNREWPEWIPPIRMIKLPLDEPPAAI